MTEADDPADDPGQAELVRAELQAVLADPAFARSPALTRLIRYLVEARLAGGGERLKSYTVAVEGLGRSPDFDPQVDTYARVLVARLRQRLDDFYRKDGADRDWRLDVPQGSYEVRLIANHPAADHPPEPDPARPGNEDARSRWRFSRKVAALVLAVLGLFIVIGSLLYRDQVVEHRWHTSDFPVVLIEPGSTADPAEAARLDAFVEDLGTAISRYEIVRLAAAPGANVTHKIRIEPATSPRGAGVRIELVDLRSNQQTVLEKQFLPDAADPAMFELANREAFRMFGFSGLAHAKARAAGWRPNTPYGCWLRFSSALMLNGALRDDQLHSCARQWYDESPQDPMAVSLYGWILANEAITAPLESRRLATLAKAVRLLEAARLAQPRSRHVLLALARVHAQRGDLAAMRQVLAQVQAIDLLNPDFKGVMGVLITLGGDQAGELLIDEAIATHPLTPPPRYYLGKFVAAMMRDDVAAAGQAVAIISAGDQTSFWSDLVRAAYYARIGQLARARTNWQHSKSKRSMLVWNDDFLIERMPAADPVKRRTRDWLEPVLDH